MTIVNIEVLRSLPFLKEARRDIVEGLAKAAVEKNFQPGQVIFQEGSTGNELYLVVEGLVDAPRARSPEVVMP